MNNMEEKLWEYIDGTYSESDKITVAALIENDEEWRNAFNDLLQTNEDISAITLEEPPMAFTYNVMEGIRKEQAAQPLKTKVNKYIIISIAAILLLSIGGLTILGFEGLTQSIENSSLDINIQLIDWNALTSSAAMKAFVYFDIMLMLFFADRFLRTKTINNGSKSV